MKKKHLLLSLMAGAILTGCSSSDDFTEGEKILDRNTTGFLRVNIAQSGPQTKSVAYDDGLKSEREINSLLFVFYDAAGKSIATQTVGAADINWEKTGEEGWNHSTANGNISDNRSLIVKMNLAAGSVMPSQVMVFANFLNSGQSSTGITGLENLTRNTYKTANGYFTMNNSVYFDAINHNRQMAVPVSMNDFKDSETAAKESNGLTIYLDRLAAKVALNLNNATTINTVTKKTNVAGKSYYLKFVPNAWGLNAVEKETYLVKHFMTNDYTTLSQNLEGWNDWNDPTNKRCYWGHTYTYDVPDVKYPQVSDDLYTGGDAVNARLNYFTYNELSAGGSNSAAFFDNGETADKQENVLYCLENSHPASILNGDYRNSAITSAIITGEYHVYDNQTDADNGTDNYLKIAEGTDAGKPVTFYIYGDSIYVSKSELMKELRKTQAVIKKFKEGETAPINLDEAEYDKVFELVHPSKAVRGINKVGESQIAIQVKAAPEALDNGYHLVYLDTDGTYKDYLTTNQTKANQSLIGYMGYIEAFTQGKSYYGVGIQHTRPLSPVGENGKREYLTGNYAVIRNHSYTINVNSISGLGVGVLDPSHKVVLPTSSISYNVKTTLNILSWRVVDSQDVNLDTPIQ